MKINRTKEKLLKGEPAFGYQLSLGCSLAAELVGSCGVDFIQLDNQHGSWGPDSTTRAFASMSGSSATIIARSAFNNFTLIGRLLDEGAMGIVVPMVNTAEEAKAAAAACRYPPRGTRWWGWARARVYGSDYPEWINDQLLVIVQIESIQAVQNAEAILSTPGIDGCWVGHSDLALSMGIAPKDYPRSEEHTRALERVVEACHNTGKFPGFAAMSPADALRRADQGFRYLTAGDDTEFMVQGALAGVKALEAGAAKFRK